MIDTILFDLDGTLLRFSQKEFIRLYISEISKVFVRMGMDAEKSVKALWAGTKSMVENDGSVPNKERFWSTFANTLGLAGEQAKAVEAACDSFYSNEFNVVKAVVDQSEIPSRLIQKLVCKGYTLVLATNPMFPACGVESRLAWGGLDPRDFILITHYANSSYCKPNQGYYNEIFTKIDKKPEQCIMIGNNPAEDMAADRLGAEVFLVTDYMENEAGADISAYRQGTLAQLEEKLISLPDKAFAPLAL